MILSFHSAVSAICNYVNYLSVCRNATRLITAVGTIHSPEFLNRDYYPTNVDCIWQITTPYNTRMRFKIMHMSIQSCGKSGTPEFCSCDYLEIRDGRSSSDRLLATLCGTRTELPETIYSSGRNLWVRFKSDGEVVSSGFVASFSSKKIKKGEWQGVRSTCLSNRPSFILGGLLPILDHVMILLRILAFKFSNSREHMNE